MKIRSGFVSNSSTCSFVIAGFYLPKMKRIEDILNDVENFPKKKSPIKERGCQHELSEYSFCKECGKPTWVEKNFDKEYNMEIRSFIYALEEEHGMKYVEEMRFLGVQVARVSSEYEVDVGGSFKNVSEKIEEIRKLLNFGKEVDAKIIGYLESC